jgi:hypothetical protein
MGASKFLALICLEIVLARRLKFDQFRSSEADSFDKNVFLSGYIASASGKDAVLLRLHNELQAQQHPADCSDPDKRFLVFQYDFEDNINGYAAMFQFLAAALSMAVASNLKGELKSN